MNYWLLKREDELYPIEVCFVRECEFIGKFACVHLECTENRKKLNIQFMYLKISMFPVEPKVGDRFILGRYVHSGNEWTRNYSCSYRIFKEDKNELLHNITKTE